METTSNNKESSFPIQEVPRGHLGSKEAHPAATSAIKYLNSLGMAQLYMHLETFSSCGIEGNKLGEICACTLNRLLNNEPVSDRYLLGLAWTIKDIEEENMTKETSA